MQKFVFGTLVQTVLIVGQFLTIEKITPKHYCINYTVMFSHLAVLHFYFSTLDMEAFSNKVTFGLGRQIGQTNSGAFGVFSAELSAPILVQ